jgi:hypothetical protein
VKNTAKTLFAFLLLVASGCDRAKTKHVETGPPKPIAFRDTVFTSITPTADGGAYAIGFSSGLWYLRGSQAVKVQFPDLSTDATDAFFAGFEITPLLDGGAYAHSLVDKSLWHLRADIAERVAEVTAISSMPPVTPPSAFPLYVAERQKRLKAEEERDERFNPDDAPEPEHDY